MRLAISNIAWDTAEDETIAGLLHRFHIDAIDVAPGKYFAQLAAATQEQMTSVKNWWLERGIEITGMQALLFGTVGLNVFGSSESQNKLLEHLAAVCRIGQGLGARRLVFGSPKNRDRSGLTDQDAMDVAVSFFGRVGDIAQSHGVVLCLEPNPPSYGANFMMTSQETARVVRHIAHPAIQMQFDTGAFTMNAEDPDAELQNHAALIGHVHASEPNLLPLGDGGTDHSKVFAALQKYLPDKVVSIEMLATKDEPHPVSIARALTVAVQHYRKDRLGVMA